MNEDISENDYVEIYEEKTAAFTESLPRIVKEFQQTAVEVSHMNDVPAAISFFVILGQVVKDFIRIPNGRNIEDSRIHFCQIQTSGTGKSTLYNFVGPVAKNVFDKINESKKHPHAMRTGNEIVPRIFDIFSVTDYTDASLIGHYAEVMEGEGNERSLETKRIKGLLEGSGLAHWDEFEYSGVFKQSQHKENSIVYLNTFMNTLAGENWIISKKLKEGDIMECFCERSVLAMTYPPKHLDSIMTEKGVLQRMLCYIWDVPEFIQDKMRRMQIAKAGTIEEIKQPIEKYAKLIFKIYQTVQEKFEENGKDALATMSYSDDYRDVLLLEYESMQQYILSSSPEIREVASNFTTRLLKILMKMAVLCSVASSPSIRDKSKRFIVTGANVRQAAVITRQCYMTLVEWLERSLRMRRRVTSANNKLPIFIKCYNEISKDEEGFVSKNQYFKVIEKEAKLSQAQIYNYWKKYENNFITEKHGRAVYIKLKEGSK